MESETVPSHRGRSFTQLFECPICFETFTRPKVLSCQHTFCLKCIYKLHCEQFYKGEKQNVVCPVCKKLHFLGAGGKEKDGKGNKQPISIDRLNGMLQNNLTLISVLDWKQQKEAQQNTLNVPSAGNSRRSSVTSRTSGGGCSRSPSPCPCQVTISGCTYCDNEHSWICLLCDEKLCNNCITGHLEMKGEHQIYNLAEESKKLEKFSRIASNDLPEQDLTSSRQRVLSRTFLSDPNLRLSLDLGEKICQPSFTPVVQMSPRPPPLPPRIRLAVDTKALSMEDTSFVQSERTSGQNSELIPNDVFLNVAQSPDAHRLAHNNPNCSPFTSSSDASSSTNHPIDPLAGFVFSSQPTGLAPKCNEENAQELQGNPKLSPMSPSPSTRLSSVRLLFKEPNKIFDEGPPQKIIYDAEIRTQDKDGHVTVLSIDNFIYDFNTRLGYVFVLFETSNRPVMRIGADDQVVMRYGNMQVTVDMQIDLIASKKYLWLLQLQPVDGIGTLPPQHLYFLQNFNVETGQRIGSCRDLGNFVHKKLVILHPEEFVFAGREICETTDKVKKYSPVKCTSTKTKEVYKEAVDIEDMVADDVHLVVLVKVLQTEQRRFQILNHKLKLMKHMQLITSGSPIAFSIVASHIVFVENHIVYKKSINISAPAQIVDKLAGVKVSALAHNPFFRFGVADRKLLLYENHTKRLYVANSNSIK